MQRKITITLNEDVYQGLYRTAGRGRISRFIEDLIRPHVTESLEAGYQAMAEDQQREAEARQWCQALAADMTDAAR